MAGDRATRWTDGGPAQVQGVSSGKLVRAAVATDAETVSKLEARCLGVDAWSPGLVAEGVRGALPTVTYLVAELDGVVVGHAVTSAVGEIAELQRIAVDGEHRRSGVGAALIDAVLDAVGTTEAGRLLLEVRVDNREALAFYADRGFAEIARRARYYADGTTAVVLELPLGRGGTSEPDPGRAQ